MTDAGSANTAKRIREQPVAQSTALDNQAVGIDTDMATMAVSHPAESASVLGKRKHDTDSTGVLRLEKQQLRACWA